MAAPRPRTIFFDVETYTMMADATEIAERHLSHTELSERLAAVWRGYRFWSRHFPHGAWIWLSAVSGLPLATLENVQGLDGEDAEVVHEILSCLEGDGSLGPARARINAYALGVKHRRLEIRLAKHERELEG